MRNVILLTVLFLSSSFALAQSCTDSSIHKFAKQLTSRLTGAQRAKTRQIAHSPNVRSITHAHNADSNWISKLRLEIRDQITPGDLAGMNIEQLVQIVMMNVYESAQQDLKDLMNDVKKMNEEKAALREYLEKLKDYACQLKEKSKDDNKDKDHKPR